MPKIVIYRLEMTEQEEAELLWNFEREELTGFYKLMKSIHSRGDFVNQKDNEVTE